jgi:hypothetical protein
MPRKSTITCKFAGCSNSPLKNRMFCAEHVATYGVTHVASHHKFPATKETNAQSKKASTIRRKKH